MSLPHFLHRLRRDERGSILIEFAFLAPVIIIAMIGVFQVAFYMQNYNSLRSVASDTARRIMVEYQRENELSVDEISAVARSIAVGDPYRLHTEQLEVSVNQEGTSRIEGAVEYTIALSYTGEDFLPIPGLDALNMTYDRPIFVVSGAEEEDEEDEE